MHERLICFANSLQHLNKSSMLIDGSIKKPSYIRFLNRMLGTFQFNSKQRILKFRQMKQILIFFLIFFKKMMRLLGGSCANNDYNLVQPNESNSPIMHTQSL